MAKVQKSIRNKRFQVKKNEKVNLTIETRNGETLVMNVVDCSFNGLQAELYETQFDNQWVEIGSIISSSKITWDNKEIFLGRLVLRRAKETNGLFCFAFSTVDVPVPVNEGLSHKLEQKLDSTFSSKELSPEQFNLAHFLEGDFTNVDLFNRVREFSYFHEDWVKSKKYAYQNFRVNSKGPRVNLRRQRSNGRNDYVMMGSNDYLGLGSHPEVVEAAKRALDLYGFGSTGSPVTTGLTELHAELCEKIARMHQKEAAILFNSGYIANLGIITSLCSTDDLVIADQLCHASIQDAMSMSRATSRFFKHNNIDHLRMILEKERANFNGCLVVTEGVFSMDGDTAPLDQIYKVAREFNCRIMVDQAHCFGVVGPNGIGICDKYHLLKETDIIMGTFSKVAGGIGGFATGSKELIDWLRSFARPQIFSVSIPPSTAAAVSKALDLFTSDKSYIENLRANIRHFIRGLNSIGCKLKEDHESAVVPVIIGDETKMGEMYQSLLNDGVWCSPVVYPAVSRKNCRFRFTVMSNHTKTDLDYAVICLEKAMLNSNFKFNTSAESTSTKTAA
ncbi:MAG: aminotransferase class I/II-fold pyridoxal phosphate-dependent enzyme [Pseudobdellovibrionaceae bacterium]|jgi:8-amino-7-oxononanoate synthase